MKFIFKPVVMLMNGLSFFKKFTLIFVLFLIPLALSLSYLIMKNL